MKNLIITLLSCCLLLTTSFGQERFLKRAQEDLDKQNWSEAESNIRAYEAKAGVRPESYFMKHWLRRLTATKVSEFDEARELIQSAISGFSGLSLKSQEEWCKDILFCSSVFPGMLREADSLLFESVKRTSSLTEVDWLLGKYPASSFRLRAIDWKIHLLFLAAKTTNTEEAYAEFLALYSEREDAPEATERMWEVAFSKANSKNTIEGYRQFIKKYPFARQVEEAKTKMADIAWGLAQNGSEDELLSFAKQYAYATYVAEALSRAENLGWKRVEQEPSVKAYLGFIEKYPNTKRRAEAISRAEQIAWTEAERTAGTKKLSQFITDFPGSSRLTLAKKLVEERAIDVLPWIQSNRKYRLYHTSKNEFVGISEYDFIVPASPNRFVVCVNQKQGIVDKSGNIILPISYESITQLGPLLFQISLNNKRGLIDKDAELIIPIEYDEISRTSAGKYIVAKSVNGKSKKGLLDAAGQTLISLKYDKLYVLSDSLYVAGSEQLVGLINEKEVMQLPPRFDLMVKGIGEQLIVSEKGKYGVMRTNGTYVIKPQLTYTPTQIEEANTPEADNRRQNCFYIGQGAADRNILFDSSGNICLSYAGGILSLGKGLFSVEPANASTETAAVQIFNANRKAFINNRRYKSVGGVGDNRLWVSESGRSGYIDTSGRPVTPFIFDEENYVFDQEGHHEHEEGEGDMYEEVDVPASKACLIYGVEWKDNLSVSYPWYEPAGVFKEGFAGVQMGQKIGFIDTRGDIRIAAQYEAVTPFYRGLAKVVKKVTGTNGEERWVDQLIDTNGTILVDQMSYAELDSDGETLIIQKTDGDKTIGFDFFNLSTKEIISIKADMNYVSRQNGYYSGSFKDITVYITEEGKRLMDRNIDFSHYNADVLVTEGRTLSYQDKIDEAIEKYKKALAIRPRFIRAMMALVDAYKEKESRSDVLYWYSRAISTSPTDMYLLAERKRYYYEKENWSEALADLKSLTQRQPDTESYWFERGLAEQKLGYTDNAIESYTRVIALNKKNATAYNNRGVGYENKRLFALAMSDYTMGIKAAAEYEKDLLGLLHLNRGNVYWNLNKKNESCQDYTKSSGFGNADARNKLYYRCR
ncbi:MAG: WG repeat-containing protein [Sphingomonadales bacterium]